MADGEVFFCQPLFFGRKSEKAIKAEIVRIIFNKFINEGMGADSICDYLNQHGYTKKKLKKKELNYFARSFIMKILDNPVYVGKIAYGAGL